MEKESTTWEEFIKTDKYREIHNLGFEASETHNGESDPPNPYNTMIGGKESDTFYARAWMIGFNNHKRIEDWEREEKMWGDHPGYIE